MNLHRSQIIELERSEQFMWSNLWSHVDSEAKRSLGIGIEKLLDGECLVTEKIKAWLFNRVIGLGLESKIERKTLDILVTLYEKKDLPVGISLCSEATTPELVKDLKNRGFEIQNSWVKMLRSNTHPIISECGFSIKEASQDQGALISEIISVGFGLDSIGNQIFKALITPASNYVYIAWDGTNPTGVGVLTINNKIGHLNTATTLPEYRGKGIQGAIMAHRLKEGIKLGCDRFVTETWSPGDAVNHSYNNMVRHGFELAYERPNWVLENQEG